MEILKVLVGSWPFITLLICCFAIVVLRRPLSEMLARVRARLPISRGELLIDSGSAATVQAESKPAAEAGLDLKADAGRVSAERLRQVRNVDQYPIIGEQEALIFADLAKLGLDQNEQIGILVKHLAVAQLLHRAEFTYRVIFGSQIAILKLLNGRIFGTKPELLGKL